MPKLYEYLGIVIFFYSNEHRPIHVHARYNGQESKIELIIKDGCVVEYLTKEVNGKRPLPRKQLKNFESLTNKLGDEIMQSWINYFVLNKNIVPKKLDGKI
jgi:hypothetical protein